MWCSIYRSIVGQYVELKFHIRLQWPQNSCPYTLIDEGYFCHHPPPSPRPPKIYSSSILTNKIWHAGLFNYYISMIYKITYSIFYIALFMKIFRVWGKGVPMVKLCLLEGKAGTSPTFRNTLLCEFNLNLIWIFQDPPSPARLMSTFINPGHDPLWYNCTLMKWVPM